MRILLFLLLFMPIVSGAQVNRSATIFAHAQIQDYLLNKLGINVSTFLIEYGALKPAVSANKEVVWSMDFKYQPDPDRKTADNKSNMPGRLYKMLFYFDRKMKIVKAESYAGG